MRITTLLATAVLVLVACGSEDAPAPSGAGAGGSGSSGVATEGSIAVWSIDRGDPPTPAWASFTAMVARLECSGGETGEVLDPVVSTESDRIVVTFAAEPLPPGDYTCQGNDEVPYRVQLDEPIGARERVDRACRAEGAASTRFCFEGAVRWRPSSARATGAVRTAARPSTRPRRGRGPGAWPGRSPRWAARG